MRWLKCVANWYIHLRIALLAAMCLICYTGHAQKTDTIFLKNKDRIIGEIKEMRYGVLTIETDYSDSDFKVTWVDIAKVKSSRRFLISLEEGYRMHTSIDIDTVNVGKIIIGYGALKMTTDMHDIVYIKSIDAKFITKLDATVSAGLNYTKSNNLTQLNITGTLAYTSTDWMVNGTYNQVLSQQSNTEQIQRLDATIGVRYFLQNNYFFGASSEFLSNDEQRLKLRVLAKGSASKYFIHSNRIYLSGSAGLAWNNEQFENTDVNVRNSPEAFISSELNIFDVKDFSMLTNGSFYLSLSEKDRNRLDYKLDLKYDLPLDFFIKLSFTINYDSKPVENATYNDYIIQTTFGWEL